MNDHDIENRVANDQGCSGKDNARRDNRVAVRMAT